MSVHSASFSASDSETTQYPLKNALLIGANLMSNSIPHPQTNLDSAVLIGKGTNDTVWRRRGANWPNAVAHAGRILRSLLKELVEVLDED